MRIFIKNEFYKKAITCEKHGNIFSLNIGSDYNGRFCDIH
jgi:hypothetical protein